MATGRDEEREGGRVDEEGRAELKEVRRTEGRSRGGRVRGGRVGGKHAHINMLGANKGRTFGRRVAEQFSSF